MWGTASKMHCGCQGHSQPAEILQGESKKKKNQDSDFTISLPSDLLPMIPCELEQSGKSRENGGWGEGGG